MAQDSDFYFPNQAVMPPDFLLLHQTELAELFQMVKGDTGTAKMQGTLDFADADWAAIFK